MFDINTLKEYTSIDVTDLNSEWIYQAGRVDLIGEALTKAEFILDKKENSLKTLKAEISLKVRKDPSYYGFEKITEDTVKEIVLVNTEVKEKTNDLIKQKANTERLRKLYNAMLDKRKALENLSQRELTGYFAEPSTKRAKGI